MEHPQIHGRQGHLAWEGFLECSHFYLFVLCFRSITGPFSENNQSFANLTSACWMLLFGFENDLVYLLVLRRPRCWMRRLRPRWTGWRFDFLWCEVDQELRVSAWLWFINGIGGGVRLWFAIRGHDIKPSNRIMFMFQVKLPHLWIQWWVVLINFFKWHVEIFKRIELSVDSTSSLVYL